MRFKVGDRVRLCKGSKHYVSSLRNPKDTEGVICRVYPGICQPIYHVNWPGIEWNLYHGEELELAEEVVYEI